MASHSTQSGSLAQRLAWTQGLFYLVSGLWPIVHPPSFQLVTGPKVDLWLVKTVGALVSVIGGALLLGARRGQVDPALALVGAGSAGALAAVDVVYVARGWISRVYLLDAAVEIPLAVFWLRGWPRRRSTVPDPFSAETASRSGL